jgi:hypothetical protein
VSGSSCGRVHRCHPPQFKFAVAILITAETKREDHHHQHAEQQDASFGSHHAVIRVYDEAGNVIETHEHAGEFKEP